MALLVAAQAAHGRFPDEQTFVLCESVEQGQILDPCAVGVAVRFARHTFVSPSEALQRLLLLLPVSQQTHGAFMLRTEDELSSELVQFEATVTREVRCHKLQFTDVKLDVLLLQGFDPAFDTLTLHLGQHVGIEDGSRQPEGPGSAGQARPEQRLAVLEPDF